MRAVLVKITFYEALFRAHYTETNPITYPIPLPPSVAGIFGAMLGWQRDEIEKKAANLMFGAKLLNWKGTSAEISRIIQFEESGRPILPPPIMRFELLVEPTFLLAMAGYEEEIEDFSEKLADGFEYLPYGGRNEYFVKDIEVLGCKGVQVASVVESYSPENWIEKVELEKEGWIKVLQVMHVIKNASEWFNFVYKGRLNLSRQVPVVEGIHLYPLNSFFWCSP